MSGLQIYSAVSLLFVAVRLARYVNRKQLARSQRNEPSPMWRAGGRGRAAVPVTVVRVSEADRRNPSSNAVVIPITDAIAKRSNHRWN